MKNNILFISILGSIILFSCGTVNRANYTSANYTNGIYYTPDAEESAASQRAREELAQLAGETEKYMGDRSKEPAYQESPDNEIIYVGDTNVVNIDYNPTKSYAIVDNRESYEERIRKFDSPTYTVNIEWNSYGGWEYWYRPHWAPYGTAWYNPWWGGYYSWWGPSYPYYAWNGWYDPWHYGWYDPWYYGWHNPWWGPSWYYPYYGPGYYPIAPPHHHGPHRDIYYGRREGGSSSGPASHGVRRSPTMNQVRGGDRALTSATRPVSGEGGANRTGGSAYRRGGNSSQNGALYNNSAANAGNGSYNRYGTQGSQTTRPANTESGNKNGNSGSMYRRSSAKPANANNERGSYNSQSSRKGEATYSSSPSRSSRGNYNGNSSSYSNSSNFRSNTGAGMGSGSTTRSSGGGRSGGSSYRR